MKSSNGMKYVYLLLGCLILLAIVIFWPMKSQAPATFGTTEYKTTTLTMGKGASVEVFNAEIADTPALQELGLSYRPSIGKNDAMLFVFPVSTPNLQFWMNGMNFPLDIIWLDSDKKIVFMEKNLSPATYPNAFGPAGDSQYVIEVAAGTADRLGLALG